MAELISFKSARRRPRSAAQLERAISRELALPSSPPERSHSQSTIGHRDGWKFRSGERPLLGVVLAVVAAGSLTLFASHLCGQHAFSDRSIVVSSGMSPF